MKKVSPLPAYKLANIKKHNSRMVHKTNPPASRPQLPALFKPMVHKEDATMK